jgi:hypothetical protein
MKRLYYIMERPDMNKVPWRGFRAKRKATTPPEMNRILARSKRELKWPAREGSGRGASNLPGAEVARSGRPSPPFLAPGPPQCRGSRALTARSSSPSSASSRAWASAAGSSTAGASTARSTSSATSSTRAAASARAADPPGTPLVAPHSAFTRAAARTPPPPPPPSLFSHPAPHHATPAS